MAASSLLRSGYAASSSISSASAGSSTTPSGKALRISPARSDGIPPRARVGGFAGRCCAPLPNRRRCKSPLPSLASLPPQDSPLPLLSRCSRKLQHAANWRPAGSSPERSGATARTSCRTPPALPRPLVNFAASLRPRQLLGAAPVFRGRLSPNERPQPSR